MKKLSKKVMSLLLAVCVLVTLVGCEVLLILALQPQEEQILQRLHHRYIRERELQRWVSF